MLAIGGIAVATIPGGDGVIHGCYAKKGGSVKVINTDKGETCRAGYLPLNWNQQGIPGKDGTDGTNGTDGITNTYLVEDTRLLVAGGQASSKLLCRDENDLALSVQVWSADIFSGAIIQHIQDPQSLKIFEGAYFALKNPMTYDLDVYTQIVCGEVN